MICDYGCEQEAKFQFKNRKYCCSRRVEQCPQKRKEISQRNKGQIPWNKNKSGVYSKDHIEFLRKRQIGYKFSEESKIKMSDSHEGKTYEDIYGKEGSKKEKEKRRKFFKENLSYIHQFIKNPSNEEIKLREIVKDLYVESEHTFPIQSYEVDIVIPSYKIAIEYDGWYHFDTEEHKEYHKKRQKEIENLGWKFIRYNIFQKFPTKEQINKDIEKIKRRLNEEIRFPDQ